MNLAPIALFVYNRPDHTLRALKSIAACPEARQSELTVFSDAAKKPEHEAGVAEVRRVLRSEQWCGQVNIVEEELNRGIMKAVISGMTMLCREHGRAIALEDDLIVSPHFLTYMNNALNRYADEPRVMAIGGFMFNAGLQIQEDALFLPFMSSWGWATWDRAWSCLDPTMSGYEKLKQSAQLRYRFNLNGTYDYFRVLERWQELDAWDAMWYVSTFMLGGLSLYPKTSLVANNGFDGTGLHYGDMGKELSKRIDGFEVTRFPEKIAVSSAFGQVRGAIARDFGPKPRQRVSSAIKELARCCGILKK